jgi:uncharacterized membrane protein YeaQ/YmgE (transglycosylase-associated protein family)
LRNIIFFGGISWILSYRRLTVQPLRHGHMAGVTGYAHSPTGGANETKMVAEAQASAIVFCIAQRANAGSFGRGKIMGLIVWLIVGAIAGWLAGLIVRGYGFGLIGNIVVGVVGALIAGWLLPRLGIVIGGGTIGEVINAVIGAVILLLVIGLIRR